MNRKHVGILAVASFLFVVSPSSANIGLSWYATPNCTSGTNGASVTCGWSNSSYPNCVWQGTSTFPSPGYCGAVGCIVNDPVHEDCQTTTCCLRNITVD